MLKSEVLELFKKYVELDTSLPSGENYPAAAGLLESWLNYCGFTTQIEEIPNLKNRIALIARRFTSKNLPTVLIYNHMDTVPADYPGSHKFVLEKGKAYGRGACDHKGSTVAILSALKELKDKKLSYNLVFLATCDEETSQKEQLKYLTKILDLSKDTVVFDPDTEAGGVSVAYLGLLHFNLTIKGKSIHSAISNLGINAVEKAGLLIQFFGEIKKEYEAQFSRYHTHPGSGLDFVCSRCNVNMIKGGIAANVVPDNCTLTVDCRYIPEIDSQKEIAKLSLRIKEFCAKQKIKYEVSNIITIESSMCENPLVDKLNKICKSISGEGGVYAVTGSTDVSEWSKKLNLPHFGIGVIRADNNIHGVNEFCYLKDVENLDLVMRKFLTE